METTGQNRPITLIVDDEPGIRNFVQHVAESVGMQAVGAVSGSDALNKLKTLSPTIIVMDMQMPNGDGVQLIQGLAGLNIDAKIVIISGADTRLLEVSAEIARQRGLDIGAVLHKPVRFEELRRTLSDLYSTTMPFSAATLRKIIDSDVPILHYQPKIRLNDASFCGVEALLRCRDAADRPVAPELAISIAEESGLMNALNDRIFRAAIEQRRLWSESGRELDVAINIPASASFVHELPDRLAAICTEQRVPNNSIILEMTESSLERDNLVAMETMARLRLMDFRLSIDDFGTGHSSLVRLRQMPFSELKIDRSFVMNLEKSSENAVIVRSLVQLAQNLEMHCVIEGVEDAYALKFATQLGCNDAQGYHIARPMPASEIREFDLTWRWRRSSLETPVGNQPAADAVEQEAKTSA
jgi:EAL domain-containing protein (putative c-di-GMP-specific phosphodiesterase class I)/ActR/RegA family two-component response regulator